MRLSNDLESFGLLYSVTQDFYRKRNRFIRIFEDCAPIAGAERYFIRFLMDRKHIIEYSIVTDRGMFLSSVQLAIGPHYFSPSEFWSYESANRFTLESSTDAIIKNLALMDEFLGYPIV